MESGVFVESGVDSGVDSSIFVESGVESSVDSSVRIQAQNLLNF